MRNIEDIMAEMNNLSEQIAVTLNTEEINGDLTQSDKGQPYPTPQPEPVCKNTDSSSACASTHSREVPFCTTINFPAKFAPKTTIADTRIIFDTNCLHCIIEECCCEGSPKFDIKVVGCIPFVVNVLIDRANKCTPSLQNQDVFLSTYDTVCVDTVICNKCSYKQAIRACATIENKLDTCCGVTVYALSSAPVTCGSGTPSVNTTGKFILPSCD